MANMNFKVNILPKTNNTYSLGNSDYKWNLYVNEINGTNISNLLLPTITSSNNGQILKVDNGAWTVGAAPTSLPSITSSDNGKILKVDNGDWTVANLSSMIGATSSTAGSSGLVPAPTTSDTDKFLAGDGTWKDGGKPMVILSYGTSTWQDFISAYNNNVIVYCRASSNSNPASGSQTRMAFMAYVNDASSPTNVEFQYYRSMSSHSATAMGDEVYVYKLTNASGGTWSVTTRKASIKEIAVASGSKLGVSWSSDKVTLSNTMTADDMPMSASDSTTAKTAIEAKYTKPSGGIPSTDLAETYLTSVPAATTSSAGLLSAADKAKLDGISGNVYTEYNITIATTDWTLDNSTYTYTYTNAAITASCLVDVIFITEPSSVLTAALDADKVSGGYQFITDTLPSGSLSLKLRIIDSDTTMVNKIVNNLTTTDAGYILDARQGKVLQDQIGTLNTDIGRIDNNYRQSLILPSNATSTLSSVNTYNGRKFSDYRQLLFVMYNSASDRAIIRDVIIIPQDMWVSGKTIHLVQQHGVSMENTSGIAISYVSDTSVNVVTLGSDMLTGYEIQGYIKLL